MLTDPLVTVIGSAVGAAIAIAIYFLAHALRRGRGTLTATTVLGWIAGIALMLFTGLMGALSLWYYTHPDHRASVDVSAVFGFIATASLLSLLLCGGIALLHRRLFTLPWHKAFAVIMIEVGIGFVVSLYFQRNIYLIADMLRGGNQNIPIILKSFETTRLMMGSFETTLIIVLIALETLVPVLSMLKLRAIRKQFHES